MQRSWHSSMSLRLVLDIVDYFLGRDENEMYVFAGEHHPTLLWCRYQVDLMLNNINFLCRGESERESEDIATSNRKFTEYIFIFPQTHAPWLLLLSLSCSIFISFTSHFKVGNIKYIFFRIMQLKLESTASIRGIIIVCISNWNFNLISTHTLHRLHIMCVDLIHILVRVVCLRCGERDQTELNSNFA